MRGNMSNTDKEYRLVSHLSLGPVNKIVIYKHVTKDEWKAEISVVVEGEVIKETLTNSRSRATMERMALRRFRKIAKG